MAPKLLRKKLLNGERDPVLHQAAKKGNAALVKIFLQYDADPWPMRKLTRTCSGCVVLFVEWIWMTTYSFLTMPLLDAQ